MAAPVNPFKKATKSGAKLRLALIGPPGSGKTYTALRIATALSKKVAVVDTENGSASKYADEFEFDALDLEGSFHPRRYIECLHAAEVAGYEVLIIDSLSHAWIGKDGGLDLHDNAVSRQKSKNSFTAWAEVTPHHQALVEALIHSRCHLIVTMRSKVEYVQETGPNGKATVRKVGTAPLMRDGLEYEFDVVGDMDADNVLVITKTRCKPLNKQAIPQPGEALAETLRAWLEGAPAPAAEAPAAKPEAPEGNGSSHTNGNGNGTPWPEKRRQLIRRVMAKDADLSREGLCQTGDLLAALRAIGQAQGLGAAPEDWPEEGFDVAVALVKAFEARVRRAKKEPAGAMREPGQEG